MKTPHDIEQLLNNTAPTLSEDEKKGVWKNIQKNIQPQPIPSPFAFNFAFLKPMPLAALGLIFALSLGGTTAAAQQARPGDLLFPVDQALEEVRLALAFNDTEKATLQIKFAEERLQELRSLLEEDTSTVVETTHSTTTTIVSLEAEADVFTDITIVEVELNDRKTTFSTDVKTRAEVVAEISSRYNIPKETVDAVLDFEVEDRASRVSDIANTNKSNDARVNASVKLLATLVDDSEDDNRSRFVKELLETLDDRKNVRVEIRKEDKDEIRIEVKDGEDRIRIREKDGETRIEVKSNNSDDEDDSHDRFEDERRDSSSDLDEDHDSHTDDSDEDDESESELEDEDDDRDDDRNSSRDDDEDSNVSSIIKIEVRVEGNTAEVRMEYSGKKLEFETIYTTKAVLIATIAARSGLTESIIESNLDIEIKD